MKKVLSIIGGFCCLVLCFILFIFNFAFLTVEPIKAIVSKDTIGEIIKDVEIREIISENPKITSNVYGIFSVMGLDIDETNAILDSNSFKKYITNYISNNIDSILGDKETEFESDSIIKLIDDIETETNIKFNNKELLTTLLENKFPEIQESLDLSGYIKKSFDERILVIIRTVLNPGLTILFVMIFVIIYLFMWLFRWSIYKPLIWYGITMTISSFICLMLFIGFSFIEGLLIPNELAKFENIIDTLLYSIRVKGITMSAVTLLIGIGMIVLYVIARKQNKKETINETSSFLDED